jgi:hypothetical protein
MGIGLIVAALALQGVAMVPLTEPVADQPQCTPDRRVCLVITGGEEESREDAQLIVTEPEPQPGTQLRGQGGTIALPPIREGRMTLALWPHAIPLTGNAEDAEGNYSMLIGVVTSLSTMYSGGGGHGRRLHLYRLHVGIGTAWLSPELVSVPLSGNLLIRACFGEEDSDQRRGACHDEYRFGADMTLAPGIDRRSELPALRYQTHATAFPRTARRMEDSSAAPPLRASDLVHWRDPDCSYTRTLRYNPATERYEMDRPAPDCSSYTVP